MGTAQGDIHDIGKNIVAAMLRCSGFTVHDLGVDTTEALGGPGRGLPVAWATQGYGA